MPVRILWAPERAGEGRRFRVIVESDTPVRCDHSAAFTLLDRTPEDRTENEHRFYFRADTPTTSGEITVTNEDGAAAGVQVDVVAEADWDTERLQGEIQLPRTWPLNRRDVSLKDRHTMYPSDEIGSSDGIGSVDEKAECEPAAWSDDEVWNLVLPCDIPRWHFLNLDKGCPVHGLDIYHTDPYYPWLVDPKNDPYRVQCPVGKEHLPTNDYAAGDFTGGDYPDDGFGYEDGSFQKRGGQKEKFGLMAYSLLRRIRYTYSVVGRLRDHFRRTGDANTAHKLCVLLVAIAREHRYLHCFPEHRFRRYEGAVEEEQYRELKGKAQYGPLETTRVSDLSRSGMDDYCINMPGHYGAMAKAYDLVFDRIDGDAELIAFVQQKLPWLTDGAAIRSFLETWLFHAGAQAVLDNTTSSNLPCPQEAMLNIIRTLGRPEARELTEWLVHGGGAVARMPSNFYYKDGAAYESVGGYNGIHVTGIIPLAEGLRELCDTYPDMYPPNRFDVIAGSRKFYHILRWPLEIIVAQVAPTLIGDHGDVPKGQLLEPTPSMSIGRPIEVFRKALEYFPGDPKFAAALRMLEAKADLPEDAKLARRTGFYDTGPEATVDFDPELFWPSRLLDGYGVGILESGEGERRRGLWLYYGDHPGHAHEQPMDMGFVANRRNLLRHMGYPYSWQHMGTWDAAWITHYGVQVMGDVNPWWRSTVRVFHGGGPFQIVEASGHGISRDRTEEGCLELPGYGIRRTLCLVDLPDGRFYGLDMFRVTGGDSHWWTFHGPPGEMTASCEDALSAQPTGTVAGEEYAYGAETPDGIPRSLAYLYDVKRRKEAGSWSATWNLKDAGDEKMRVTQIGPDEGELVFARGRSPHAPADNPPYELDWALRHVEGKNLDSEFVCALEADTELPVVNARQISSGDVSVVQVETADVVHRVLRADADSCFSGDGIEFRGRAGFVETDRKTGDVLRMSLVGEGSLTLNGRGIARGAADWCGVVEELDTDACTITIRAEEAPPEDLCGEYLMITRSFAPRPAGDSFAYRIESREQAGDGLWRFSLVWSSLIGDGMVRDVAGRTLLLRGEMPLTGSRSFFRGAYLVGDDGRRVQIGDVRGAGECTSVLAYGQNVNLEDEGFRPGQTVTIQEIAPGNEARITGWTRVVADENGTFVTEANGSCEVTQ